DRGGALGGGVCHEPGLFAEVGAAGDGPALPVQVEGAAAGDDPVAACADPGGGCGAGVAYDVPGAAGAVVGQARLPVDGVVGDVDLGRRDAGGGGEVDGRRAVVAEAGPGDDVAAD